MNEQRNATNTQREKPLNAISLWGQLKQIIETC